MKRLSIRILAVVLGLAGVAVIAVSTGLVTPGGGAAQARGAPGLDQPVTAAELQASSYQVTMAVLGEIYDAFAKTDETAIYDGLAEVAAGEALEALYLERAGALAGGGLPDQVVHELQLLSGNWALEGGAMQADIRWAVLGEVGHAEHTHMRGNAYAAELSISPVGEVWRLTDFVLTDVDRSDNGTLTTIEPAGGEAVAE